MIAETDILDPYFVNRMSAAAFPVNRHQGRNQMQAAQNLAAFAAS